MTRWEINSPNHGIPERINIYENVVIHEQDILTHDEEQFQDNQEVSFSFTLYNYRSISPVINQEVDCAQEAEDIGGLETDQDAVKI